ncbi:hypothetical protein EYC84_003350 [Monilinia fructicola]|uniref:Uncharacterized protein n=1 Tax=Monilinia fructicola TaxID=38448 RepID=A0A5M9K1H5_MONFR|nr:hypothetical protein EYC84_003350 [Monilinia fructicola]
MRSDPLSHSHPWFHFESEGYQSQAFLFQRLGLHLVFEYTFNLGQLFPNELNISLLDSKILTLVLARKSRILLRKGKRKLLYIPASNLDRQKKIFTYIVCNSPIYHLHSHQKLRHSSFYRHLNVLNTLNYRYILQQPLIKRIDKSKPGTFNQLIFTGVNQVGKYHNSSFKECIYIHTHPTDHTTSTKTKRNKTD